MLLKNVPNIFLDIELSESYNQSWQIPYEVVPTIEPWHHAHDIMIDSQVIKLHAWLLDNALLDVAHIVCCNAPSIQGQKLTK